MPIQFVRNDIIRMQVDAIVNTSNKYLRGGIGVNGAIHKAAGQRLEEECAKLNGCGIDLPEERASKMFKRCIRDDILMYRRCFEDVQKMYQG